MEDPGAWLIKIIKDFIESPVNSMNKWDGEPALDKSIIGFSNGSDPLYQLYKDDIGAYYLTPVEFSEYHYPDANAKSEKLTVLSWILPQTEKTKTDQRKKTHFPSESRIPTGIQ